MIDNFKNQKILVIGDLILDEYLFGDVHRINPEAPVPIVNVDKKEFRLGGAANVAHNIVSLGAKCFLIGQVGNDETKSELVKELNKTKIEYFLIENNEFHTVKKTRVIARNQQLVRVDWENLNSVKKEDVDKILQKSRGLEFDLIIISDYAKGIVDKTLVNELKKIGTKILVDPRPKNAELYKDVFAICPNLEESKVISKRESLNEIGKEITSNLNTNLIITAGQEGAYYFNKDNQEMKHFPTNVEEVYDVSGAGDTFIASLGLSIGSGNSIESSIKIANKASGIVIGKIGTATVSIEELRKSFLND